MSKTDMIDHPPHYAAGRKHEPISVIEEWCAEMPGALAYHCGNALKYISRAGRKEGALIQDDLRKAAWYLSRAAQYVEGLEPLQMPANPAGGEKAADEWTRGAVQGATSPVTSEPTVILVEHQAADDDQCILVHIDTVRIGDFVRHHGHWHEIEDVILWRNGDVSGIRLRSKGELLLDARRPQTVWVRRRPAAVPGAHQVKRPSADDVLQAGRTAATKAIHAIENHTGGFYRLVYPGGAEIVGHGKPGEPSAPRCGTCKNWQHFEREWGHCQKQENVDTTDDCVHPVCPGHEPVADDAAQDENRPSTAEGITGSPEPEKTCGTCKYFARDEDDPVHGSCVHPQVKIRGTACREDGIHPAWLPCPGHEPK